MLKEASEMPGFFEKQLENCGVEYFDYYLLHALDEGAAKQAEEWGAFDFMLEKKAKGLVKHVGFSFHDKAEDTGQDPHKTSGNGICAASAELCRLGG